MTTVERFVEVEIGECGRRSLSLEQCEGIQLGESLVTPEILEEDAQSPSFKFAPTSDASPDDLVLRRLAYGTMPLKIIGESASLRLRAELVKFPPSDDLPWSSHTVRLIPSSGSIAQIILDRRSELVINHVERLLNSVTLDLGNGCLRLEVHYNEQDPKNLPPLTPPVFP